MKVEHTVLKEHTFGFYPSAREIRLRESADRRQRDQSFRERLSHNDRLWRSAGHPAINPAGGSHSDTVPRRDEALQSRCQKSPPRSTSIIDLLRHNAASKLRGNTRESYVEMEHLPPLPDAVTGNIPEDADIPHHPGGQRAHAHAPSSRVSRWSSEGSIGPSASRQMVWSPMKKHYGGTAAMDGQVASPSTRHARSPRRLEMNGDQPERPQSEAFAFGGKKDPFHHKDLEYLGAQFRMSREKRPKHFFISPDWISEGLMIKRLNKENQSNPLSYGWI